MEAGVLARATRSVLAPKNRFLPSKIIVVDDGSPIRAQDELEQFTNPYPDLFLILTKGNGDPGQARNVGLDNVPPEADYAAFLDSDDEWFPDLLSTALRTLELGYDFYFCNFFQMGQEKSLFERYQPIQIDADRVLDSERQIYEFSGDINDALIHNNFIRTSGCFYRWSCASTLRFNEDLRWSDEDTLFWLDLCSRVDRVAFSWRPLMRQGRGVNINASANEYGNPRFSTILLDEFKFYNIALNRFAENDEQRQFLARTIRDKRYNFIKNSLYLFMRGEFRINFDLIRKYWAVDRTLPLHVVPFLFGLATRRFTQFIVPRKRMGPTEMS